MLFSKLLKFYSLCNVGLISSIFFLEFGIAFGIAVRFKRSHRGFGLTKWLRSVKTLVLHSRASGERFPRSAYSVLSSGRYKMFRTAPETRMSLSCSHRKRTPYTGRCQWNERRNSQAALHYRILQAQVVGTPPMELDLNFDIRSSSGITPTPLGLSNASSTLRLGRRLEEEFHKKEGRIFQERAKHRWNTGRHFWDSLQLRLTTGP